MPDATKSTSNGLVGSNPAALRMIMRRGKKTKKGCLQAYKKFGINEVPTVVMGYATVTTKDKTTKWWKV